MTLKLNGSSSGSVSLDAPASTTGGADVALTFPVDDGTANQALTSGTGGGALTWGGNTPAFSVRKSADQSADSNNTWYKVEWETEDFDTDNAFDNTNDKFVVPAGKGGIYQINVQVTLTAQTSDAELDLKVYKNGSALTTPSYTREYSGTDGASNNTVQHSHLYDLDAADYLEIYIWHGSGGTNVIEADSSCWSMFRLLGTA